MAGPSLPTDPIAAWARDAVRAAAGGDVCDENLRALLGPGFWDGDVWEQSRAGFLTLLEAAREIEAPLVLKLVVPLTEREELTPGAPSLASIRDEIDRVTPPSLVAHPPLARRDWAPVEEYRLPLDEDVFGGEASGLYVAFRDEWERADGGPYRRQLLFERAP